MVEKHLLGQRRALAQREQLQHLIFLAGQVHPRSIHFDGLLIEVDRQVARDDDRLRMSLRTAHDGVNAGDEFVLVERLRQIVVRAVTKPFDLVLDPRHPGQNEDRRLDLGDPERAQHLIAGHVGQIQVEQDDVVIIKLAEVDALLAKVGDIDVEVLRLQHQFDALRGRCVVFDQKYPHVRLPASPIAS